MDQERKPITIAEVIADGQTIALPGVRSKYSLIDSHDSGKFDVMGIHSDGSLQPSSYVPYNP
jgi:hypothetical protein